MTLKTVETRIGAPAFFDGMPNEATVQKYHDNLDFLRGVAAFLKDIPATSIEAIRRGTVQIGATRCSQCLIMDKLVDSAPPQCGPGALNDPFSRFFVDMGVPGHDRGGGRRVLGCCPRRPGRHRSAGRRQGS